ncbi:MAG TPA: nucleotidyltransferase family protein [Candidatus Dormibacteraeota bacterium]|nr:nucleotidyltransferase family protein [Candidatus Dormibacteraeota bacterium]
MKTRNIVPIVLAAGGSDRLGFPKPLARFGEKTAIEIALENCAGWGLGGPIVVLGCDASEVRKAVPRGVKVVINRRWQEGQLGSLLAGLQHVAKNDAFMIYPVDHPLLTRSITMRLVSAFRSRSPAQTIVMPRFKRYPGHPVICAPEIRPELAKAKTARDVTYRTRRRIRYLPVRSPGVYLDFGTPETYLDCLKRYGVRKHVRRKRF